MKIVNCFTYFNEIELLELRIKLLHNKIDEFIIADANRTHSGQPKPFSCKKSLKELKLDHYNIKVIEVDLSKYDESNDAWTRERAQRDAIADYIEENALYIVNDCDEIINPEYIKYYADTAKFLPMSLIAWPLAILYRKASIRLCDVSGQEMQTYGSFICFKHHLKNYTLSDLRESFTKNQNIYINGAVANVFLIDNGKIEDAGWHLTWMGNENRVKLKKESFAHHNECSLINNNLSLDYLLKFKEKTYDTKLLPKIIFELPNISLFLGLDNKQSTNDNFPHDLLEKYILDPNNYDYNFQLALYYESIDQTAAALSFFLRAAERTDDSLAAYICLLRASICFKKQGTRNFTAKSLLLHALSICPKRPEAYYFMSKFNEEQSTDGHWNDCYTISSIGLGVSDFSVTKTGYLDEYPGKYGLIFQKALSAWWCGLCEESKNIFVELLYNYNVSDEFKHKILYNLKHIDPNFLYSATPKKTKIVDFFSFYGPYGSEILLLRYHMYKDIVDEFIVSESSFSHSGLAVPFECKKKIKEWGLPEHKFKVIELNTPPDDGLIIETIDELNCIDPMNPKNCQSNIKSKYARVRDRLSKDALLKVIDDYDDNTVFIHSDIDEIINPKYIIDIADQCINSKNAVIYISLLQLEARADLILCDRTTNSPLSWQNCVFMCSKEVLKKATPTQIRSHKLLTDEIKKHKPIDPNTGNELRNIGWHFSWMGGKRNRLLKKESWEHRYDSFDWLISKNYKDHDEFLSKPYNEGDTPPCGIVGAILRKYPIDKLPQEIFKLPIVQQFLFNQDE